MMNFAHLFILPTLFAMFTSLARASDTWTAPPTSEKARIIQVFDSLRQDQDGDRPYRYSDEGVDLTKRSFVCVSAQGAILALGGRYLKCLTVNFEVFTMTTFGFSWRYGAAWAWAYGQIGGPLKNGVHAIQSGYGGFFGIGGSYFSAGPVTFIESGAGLEFHKDGGAAADSMFGGQLVITVPKKTKVP